ncbi:MAG: hypothetical protein CVT72_03730 [Alphaproteobacteria bacterium HGW-Alphaproteobacteria-11]|nr:MAG: hypothetical protein CVT72_03730 [Alphaproteobacteria bacterium HGW-Alphaproteobacteria-11]
MNWLKDRAKEPTTYVGLSAAIYGLGTLAKVNEAPAVADAVSTAAPALAAGDWATGLLLLIGGALAAVMKEKGGK